MSEEVMKLNSLYLLLLMCCIVLAACNFNNRNFKANPTAWRDDKEILIEKTIRRAVVDEKDIPDYSLIKDKRSIFLSNLVVPFWEKALPSDTININSVPQFEEVKIVLASPSEIQKVADEKGDFLYLAFGKIEIIKDVGMVEIETRWAVNQKRKEKGVYLSGGGYTLQFRKHHNGEWKFEKMLRMWIS